MVEPSLTLDAPKVASVWRSNLPQRGQGILSGLRRVKLAHQAFVVAFYHWFWKVVQRLKSRAEFQAVLAGRVVSKTVHFALHQLVTHPGRPNAEVNGSGDVWLGAMIPKRWAKRAVTRNMIKRQAYTVLSLIGLPQAAYVVRLRRDFSKTQFVSATSAVLKSAVRQELHQLIGTAHTWGQPQQPTLRPTSLRQAVA